jgi:quercetin dioxygenase-like cupin family protein
MHHTDTVDLNFIVSGSCELVLDDGNHTCGAGDLVVVPGVDHSWINGPDGCVFNSVTVGTTPLD